MNSQNETVTFYVIKFGIIQKAINQIKMQCARNTLPRHVELLIKNRPARLCEEHRRKQMSVSNTEGHRRHRSAV